jgi:calcium/proton exchanger cax
VTVIGSILSNLLLVLGMCFFAGGTRFSEQGFGIGAAQINSSLLVMAVIAVLLPAAFDYAVTQGRNGNGGRKITDDDPDYQLDILHLSHGVAIILLLSAFTLAFCRMKAERHVHHSLRFVHHLPALHTHASLRGQEHR